MGSGVWEEFLSLPIKTMHCQELFWKALSYCTGSPSSIMVGAHEYCHIYQFHMNPTSPVTSEVDKNTHIFYQFSFPTLF